MRAGRLVKQSMRAMRRYKLRSGFIMLGSFVGAAALTLVISIGQAAERKILTTMRQLFGASSIIVMAGGTQLMSGPRPNSARLTIDDIEAVAAEVPQIEIWDPQQAMPNATVRLERSSLNNAGTDATARILGVSERAERVWERTVSRGEYFDLASVRSSERVALIGETVAAELFGTADPIGADIIIGNVPFRVIGVLERFGTDIHGMDRDDEIVVPITTMMRRVMNVDTIPAAKLLVRDPSQVDAASAEVKRVLRERHGRNDFGVITASGVQEAVAKAQRILAIYLPIAAGIAMLVGAIVAATLMLAAVNERVSEIGLRRAVGARVEDIQLQFLAETIATMFLGGLAGMAVGFVGAQLVATKFSLGNVALGRAFLLATLVTLVTGFLAGVLPARRAARLDPAEALR